MLYNYYVIITPQGIGKGIKKEKILFGLVFIACACVNPGIEFATLACKETFTLINLYPQPKIRNLKFSSAEVLLL